MADKIRLGFVGANVRSTWASQPHFPALLASPDVELTAVCTTRPESAEEARRAFGAQLAFHDFRAMVASPAIDAVAVVVKVPEHYGPTRAAIEAGKHVYTEWPLGRTTAEAEELAALARAKGVQTAVGLQSRVSPTLMYMKEQIASGYVGEVLFCHVSCIRDGSLERPPAAPGSAMPASARTPSPSPTVTLSMPCASSWATSRGWRVWSRPRPGNGTRPTRSSWWRSPRRTTCWSADSWRVARWLRPTSPPPPGPAAASGWRSTGGKARWS